MYSRLYVNVLNNYHWVNGATALHTSYSDGGLFTISCACPPEDVSVSRRVLVPDCDVYISKVSDAQTQVGKIEVVIYSEMGNACNHLTQEELDRAKNMLKGLFLMNLESLPIISEDICRFFLQCIQK